MQMRRFSNAEIAGKCMLGNVKNDEDVKNVKIGMNIVALQIGYRV